MARAGDTLSGVEYTTRMTTISSLLGSSLLGIDPSIMSLCRLEELGMQRSGFVLSGFMLRGGKR